MSRLVYYYNCSRVGQLAPKRRETVFVRAAMNCTSKCRARRVAAGVAACLSSTLPALAPNTLTAQVPAADSSSSRWLIGGSIGMPHYNGELVSELLTVGMHWTHVRANRPGADFALGTMPRTLGFGALSLGLRAGVALPLLLSPGVMMLPSGGVSLIGGFGSSGAGGEAGYNFGLSAVLTPPKSAFALRVGATRHTFQTIENVWLLEIGVARVPGRRRPQLQRRSVRAPGG